MAKVDELTVEILGDIKGLTKSLKESVDQTEKTTSRMSSSFEKVTKSITGVQAGFAKFGLAVQGAKSLVEGFSGVVSKLNDARGLKLSADRLGVSSAKFQELAYAARLAGANADDLYDSMKDLNVRITDAANGATAYEEVLNKVGLTSKELVSLPMDQQIVKFANAVSKASSEMQIFAVDELMSDPGLRMIEVWRGGEKVIDEAARSIREMNGIIDDSQFEELKEATKEVRKMEAAWDAFATTLGSKVAPTLTDVFNGLNKIISGASGSARPSAGDISEAMPASADQGGIIQDEETQGMARSTALEPLRGLISGGITREQDEERAAGMIASGGEESMMTGMPWILTEEGQSQADAMRELEIQKQQDFNARLREIEEYNQEYNKMLWESGWKGKLDVMGSTFGKMGKLMNSESRKMFEIGKAARIAEVIATTPKAAMDAYSAMASIPYVGPALGAAAAASAIAYGAQQVQQIQSTQFRGGGGGGGGAGPSVPDAGSAEGGGQEVVQTTNFDVTLQGDSFSNDQVRGLIGQINEATDDGVKLNAVMVR